ncbi:hypothetical protein [Streptomyces mutabilis]|uniref:Uncharacterized protein n=1 Tax=Streptomyces mutabilis TaxID=67332 RepID=A0A086MRH6_9ACTN|nr:hypothetical protein [Streptomyces mutabilis]KFG71494.1 hypothetical protein FM21_35150 [Streptomyces mutabilis]
MTDQSTPAPLTDQQLTDIARALPRLSEYAEQSNDVRTVAEGGPALLAAIRRLRNDLAEEKAAHDPRLRCLIVKAAPDRDQYVGWSTVCEMPAGVWSRESALEYGFPPSRLDRADATGSSSHIGDGAWEDRGFVAEQRGWLRRDRLGEYAVEYLHGDREAAYALLEPFEDEAAAAAGEADR